MFVNIGSLSRIPENSRFTEESQQLTPNKLRRHNGEYPPVTGSSRMSGRSTGQLRDTRSESGMSMASTGSGTFVAMVFSGFMLLID